MNNNLSVIIPTYSNVSGLKYLLEYFKKKPYKVVIIDNCLDSRLRGNDTKQVIYLSQKRNLGFAGGVNKGAKNVETKWMLILNDDIIFQDQISNNTIESLIKFAEENRLNAVSPILRNPSGSIENLGYKVLPYGKIKLIKGRDDNDIDGITAACLLIKTAVFKKLGGFDESFFAYLEDVDLFLRMKNNKFGIAYDIEVLHNHMATTKTMGNFKARQDMINWWRLFLKHPKKFKFNLDFIVERMRNVSGYIKASFK